MLVRPFRDFPVDVCLNIVPFLPVKFVPCDVFLQELDSQFWIGLFVEWAVLALNVKRV